MRSPGCTLHPSRDDLAREDVERRRGEKVARLLRGRQQRANLVAHAGVGTARTVEEIRARAGGMRDGFA